MSFRVTGLPPQADSNSMILGANVRVGWEGDKCEQNGAEADKRAEMV